MKQGKIAEPILKRSVLKKITYKDKAVLCGAKVGHDGAVISLDKWLHDNEDCMVMTTATVVDKRDYHHNRAFIKAVNNLVTTGATPKYAQIAITLPEGMREIKLKMLMEEMGQLATSMNMQITGGHTMVSDAVCKPVVSVTAIGSVSSDAKSLYSQKTSIKPGYDIVMSKAVGLEGTALLAEQQEEEFLKRFTSSYIDVAKKFIDDISVVKEANIAKKCKVVAMHDISEGGVFGALWELGEAGNCGLKVDLKKITVRQETIELTHYMDINPYTMASSGSLLMVTADGLGLVDALAEEGIAASIIGKITDDNDRVIVNEDEKRFLEPPRNS
ncbi:MAG: AIR synthase family protein [Lachnospiraceae bacterium]|nr:AIR synthase family protein [Lachnospiraceae bacterium]